MKNIIEKWYKKLGFSSEFDDEFADYLKEIKIPDKVTEIKPSTFCGCSSLERVDLGRVTKIGKDAFLGCDALKDITVDNGVTIADGNDALTGAKK